MTAPRDIGRADDPGRNLDHDLVHALDAEPDGDALRAIWRDVPVPAELPVPDAAQREAAWQRLRARLDAPVAGGPTVPPARAPMRTPDRALLDLQAVRAARNPWRAAWRLAAVIALMVTGAAVWQGVPETLTVPAGAAPRTVRLADASRITIAPGSTVRLQRGFRTPLGVLAAERTVRLAGEAFFDVGRDGRPFVVHAGDATVRVLGTRFAVRSAGGDGEGLVVVEEGRVAVARVGTSMVTPGMVTLGAGQATALRPGEPLAVVPVAADRLTAWRSGGFAAFDESLATVTAALERRFGTEIRLAPGIPAAQRLSIYYPSAPAIDTILADLCTARGLSLRRTSRGWVIAPPSAGP